jgi:phage shock protein A
MTLITRITRLFKADIHGILDTLEEPAAVLRQAVRDMEEEIGRGETKLQRIATQRKRCRAAIDSAERIAAELNERLDICFDEDKEDLARAIVRRKLEQERLRSTRLEADRTLEQEHAFLAKALDEQREKLSSVREKWELLKDSRGAKESSFEQSTACSRVADDEVEAAFLSERRKRRGASDTSAEQRPV